MSGHRDEPNTNAESTAAAGADGGVIPRLNPDDTNPASDLKTDVIRDVEREHTFTSDVVGPRRDEISDEDSDLEERS
jgi:hypothetical protein